MTKFTEKKLVHKLGIGCLIGASCFLSLPSVAIAHHPPMAKAEVYDSNWMVIEVDQGPYSNILEASQVFTTALYYYYDDNLVYAAIAFKKALEYDPGMAKAHYLLGNTYYQLGRLVSAMEEYEKALALNPFLTKARINLGAAFADQGNYSEAVTEYEQALQLEPNNAIATFNLGVALVQLEQREQGIVVLNNAKTMLYEQGYSDQAQAVERYIQCRAVPTISGTEGGEVFECE